MNLFSGIYLSARFYAMIGMLILLMCISFFVPWLYHPSVVIAMCAGAVTVLDGIYLFGSRLAIGARRVIPVMLSLSDANKIGIVLRNFSKRFYRFEIVDELPVQLQVRDFSLKGTIEPLSNQNLHYEIRPLVRGSFGFGNINVFLSSRTGLVKRRVRIQAEVNVPVYPSVLQMKNFELYSVSKIARAHGIKKMRRIGMSYEFEQIKTYVRGDDVRHLNWKASARSQNLMINQFSDEKSQPIYNIIDKSRIMLMPFNGMSLMDYAINTSLVISNAALKKYDKAGLMTFSNKIGAMIRADRRQGQLQSILNALYDQKERETEADFELLYFGIRQMIRTRSLIFLYTNFESMYGLKRVLPVLKKISRQHLLIVVFFENSELEDLSRRDPVDLKGVYTQIIAEQTINDKQRIANELNMLGIQTILSRPEDLSLNTVNKYLEVKSRGMI